MKQIVVLCVLAVCGYAIADIGLDLQGYDYTTPKIPFVSKNPTDACPPIPPPPPPCPLPPKPVVCPVCRPPLPPVVCPTPPPPPPPCQCTTPPLTYIPPPGEYLPPNKRFRKL